MRRTFWAGWASAPRSGTLPGLWWKRPLDLVAGGLALLLAIPLIACLALAVVLESGRPAFFVQERIGRGGEPFRMWKLRSMRRDAPSAPHERSAAAWFAGQPDGHLYKTLADPRVTRVGRFLRRTNLDELPQLFNVLAGEMSLVGPRPAIAYELTFYRPQHHHRFDVPPGITGLWQVTRRELLPASEMMELDLRYVREASPWLDVAILARTVPAVIAGAVEGA